MKGRETGKIIEVRISSVPIELFKILKIENLVASGGEAKAVVAEGCVKVNGETETRKRKKIFAGDIVEYQGRVMQIVI